MQNVFPRLSESPGRIRALGPELGADTEAVLRDMLGYDASRIAELRDKGVI
jgi:crotonobetainyl-CoA:carnitine CoA-transferase CaiB-like acyl-CoA transferase